MLKVIFYHFTLIFILCVYQPGFASISADNYGSSSIALSTSFYEDDLAYHLDISIEGIKPADVKITTSGYTIFITAKQSSKASNSKVAVSQRAGVAGSQLISLNYTFPDDADMKKMKRENKTNLVAITVPRK